MNKLLIVEDDPRLLISLKNLLTSHRRRIFVSDQVERAIDLIDQHRFQLAIIDRCLTDGDGIELVRYFQQYSYQTRLLILTQLSEPDERVKGLLSGADDYLIKPFTYRELDLRVEKLLQKRKLVCPNQVKSGAVELHFDSGCLFLKDELVKLRKKEADILKILMLNTNQVISKGQLINQVWTGLNDQPSFNTVEVYIRRLRMKLGTYGSRLKTIRSFGYCWSKSGK
ncbi:MAG: response regulator [Candidatus Pacebacteria bacterium]|nr:response regulator [Candidatus Paceibacterota bacterium]